MLPDKPLKILILVLCSRNYLSFISSRSQLKIWKKYNNIFEIQHYIGKLDPSVRERNYINKNYKDYLVIDTNDNYKNIAEKTFLAFEEALKFSDFDFIFRTNTSSYINLSKFEKFIQKKINQNNYSGVNLKVQEGDLIASGAGILLSRGTVEKIVKNKDLFDSNLPDDVAIARQLAEIDIFPNNLPRRDLKKVPTPNSVLNSQHFHYRCRLDPQHHRILEPMLIRYLEKVSKKNKFNDYFYYLILKSIFYLTNFKILYKLIQKYYSYKFYGEINIKNLIIFDKKKFKIIDS